MDNESDKEKGGKSEELYYMENGLIVFTEAYHLKRGYCCKRGCRHCPYGFNKKEKGDDKLERG
jgi:hypothetical protein